ncbi:sce7726 family protein [Acinetobacter brisouii]|uniref:sce7726 family protein n=1 Tax=Acinetobacter brisouii TaxID=396323 RepID=UPI0006976D20|nr:sce7726 family protein [Acinetobacter brisouii]
MNEKQIRSCLINYLSNKHDLSNTAFISELFINNFTCRADVVMANGQLSVFEIKSKFDTLDRLPNQIKNYISVFENVIVVCAEKHVEKVLEEYESTIGVWLIDESGQFTIKRRSNRQKLDVNSWLTHLPVDELKNILRVHNVSLSGNREALIEKVKKHNSKMVIREFVLDYFKRRDEKISTLRKNKQVVKSKSSELLNLENEIELNQKFNSIDVHKMTILPRKTKANPNPRPIPVRLRS